MDSCGPDERERIAARRARLNLAGKFAEEGRSYVELGADGNVVKRGADDLHDLILGLIDGVSPEAFDEMMALDRAATPIPSLVELFRRLTAASDP